MSTENATLLRDGFEAFLRGDFDALRELMEPDAQWLWWEPIPGDCHDREKIIATLRDRHAEGVVTGLNEIVEGGEKLLVEITGPRLEEWGLPERRACMVVTMRDGRIVRMQDHRNRAEALADAGLAPRPAVPPPAPLEHTEPGWDQVSDLVPLVHVADVTASIAFYEHLGFHVTATHPRHRRRRDHRRAGRSQRRDAAAGSRRLRADRRPDRIRPGRWRRQWVGRTCAATQAGRRRGPHRTVPGTWHPGGRTPDRGSAGELASPRHLIHATPAGKGGVYDAHGLRRGP